MNAPARTRPVPRDVDQPRVRVERRGDRYVVQTRLPQRWWWLVERWQTVITTDSLEDAEEVARDFVVS